MPDSSSRHSVAATGGAMPPVVVLALSIQVLISAGTYLAAKRAMVDVTPFTLVLLRFLISGSVFILLVGVTQRERLPSPKAFLNVLWLGLLAGPVNQGLFFYGLSLSTASHASLLYALTPVGVYLVALLEGSERVSRRAIAGIAVAFAGVFVLLLGRGLADAMGPLKGDLFILAAVAAWVLYTIRGKALTAEVGPIRATGWTMSAGAILSVPAMPWLLDWEAVNAAPPITIACALYLGVMTSVIAYLLWYYALSRSAASKVAVFSNLQPPATAIASWLILGEPLTWNVLVGGALVLAGVRLTQRA